ncbi:MAG: MSHA biogenesis protein MshE [Betaproteobacteria bacterium 13_1_20CM_3_63_8]|nr:MAG: MSHA biogenesis protein MshE [Betaproteobacteria bacterium 13_1_20CM_3_63_8]
MEDRSLKTTSVARAALRPQRMRLGDVLVAQKLITVEQLRTALEAQTRRGRRLGRLLVELGYLSDEQVAQALARQLSLRYVDLAQHNFNPQVVQKLPESAARRFRAVPLEERGNTMLVAMADPADLFAYDELTRILKRDVQAVVVPEGQLLKALDQVYRRTEEITGLAKELQQDLGDNAVDFGALSASLGADDAPVVRLLQTLFEDATQVGASDIHIEPQEDGLRIRLRIDGELNPQTEADLRVAPALALRLKLMAGLDISEKRLPQDGRFNVLVRDKAVDVRMSTMPTAHGESVVMRLLNRESGLLGLDKLGMPAGMTERFRTIINRVSGMVLVTGPTGSGKTTTLYAALNELNSPSRKIITVEDPVEYRVAGLNQVQVHEKIDLTFATVLRSVLRQDPDVILVGEVRDTETAQIGLRAAITGHMVLSTLHVREAASVPVRLLDMGVPRFMVATALQAVIAQRLVRLICERCAQAHVPSAQESRFLELEWAGKPGEFKRGAGCRHCNNSGYRGRAGVYEMLEMTPRLVEAVAKEDVTVFMRIAQEEMAGRSFVQHAAALAASGRTTLAEAMGISQAEE